MYKIRSDASPLHFASYSGFLSLVREMLRGGNEIFRKLSPNPANSRNSVGETALSFAAAAGHLDVAHLLLDEGAKVNNVSLMGWSALHEAAGGGFEAVMQLLLKRGAKIDIRDKDGYTPLVLACFSRHEMAMQLLLENGADFNIQATDGETPLHIAVCEGYETGVSLLLNKGSDCTVKSKRGMTPLDEAVDRRNKNVLKMLLKHEAKHGARINGTKISYDPGLCRQCLVLTSLFIGWWCCIEIGMRLGMWLTDSYLMEMISMAT